MSTTITEIQTTVGEIVTANTVLLKHSKSNEITKRVLCFLENKGDNYFKNVKHLKSEAYIIFAIYIELYKQKYYSTLPDWTELVNRSSQVIKQTIKNQSSVKSLKELLTKPKFVKDCMTPVFVVLKQKLVDENFLKEVTDFISELHCYSASNDIVNIKAEERFWKYYDPARPNNQIIIEKEGDTLLNEDDSEVVESDSVNETDKNSYQTGKNSVPWKGFLYRSYRWAENSYNSNRFVSLDAPQGNDSDTPIIDTLSATEETNYTWFYDMLRDLIITNLKITSTKNQLKFQLCFFTDDISSLLNDSPQFYRHLRIFEKQYSSTVNLDFLNFFVDYPCLSIIDSYHKPRKKLSQFNHRKISNDTPCKQPLELCVYASFFNQTEQNISNQRKTYEKRKKEFITEHYSEYV